MAWLPEGHDPADFSTSTPLGGPDAGTALCFGYYSLAVLQADINSGRLAPRRLGT